VRFRLQHSNAVRPSTGAAPFTRNAPYFPFFHRALAHFPLAASSAFFLSSSLALFHFSWGPIEFYCALKLFWYSSLKHATSSMPVVGRPAAPAPWDPSAPCASVVLLFFSAAAGPASYELRVCVCVCWCWCACDVFVLGDVLLPSSVSCCLRNATS